MEDRLKGKAIVCRLATSKSLGDPTLLDEVKLVLGQAKFDVVHFNNGMHGWGYTEEEYAKAIPELIATIRKGAPQARLIWASTTPVRVAGKVDQLDPRTDRVKARNIAAAAVMTREKIPTNDLFALVDWLADTSIARPDDRDATELFDNIMAVVLTRPAPDGVSFDANGVAVDDIWTYERAPGRRIVFLWRAAELPGAAVQLDVVFGEELADLARGMSVPVADGGCISARAASPAQSLAWKLLWLISDMYPQGKDLYDAVLLAEQSLLPMNVLAETLRRGGVTSPPVTSAGLTLDWRVDWDNFRTEYPGISGEVKEWLLRLEKALEPTFAVTDRMAANAEGDMDSRSILVDLHGCRARPGDRCGWGVRPAADSRRCAPGRRLRGRGDPGSLPQRRSAHTGLHGDRHDPRTNPVTSERVRRRTGHDGRERASMWDWKESGQRFPVGRLVTGVVTSHRHFGIFIDLNDPGATGIILVPEFVDAGRMTEDQFPPVGTLVTAAVLRHTGLDLRQVSMTMRPKLLQSCGPAMTEPEWLAQLGHQSSLLRDIFGNPFRPVAVYQDWLTTTVLALARQIDDTRDDSLLPTLADALQDSGCEDADCLVHCPEERPHVRGCWVVDSVLGKT